MKFQCIALVVRFMEESSRPSWLLDWVVSLSGKQPGKCGRFRKEGGGVQVVTKSRAVEVVHKCFQADRVLLSVADRRTAQTERTERSCLFFWICWANATAQCAMDVSNLGCPAFGMDADEQAPALW